jgi:hypothetical protein
MTQGDVIPLSFPDAPWKEFMYNDERLGDLVQTIGIMYKGIPLEIVTRDVYRQNSDAIRSFIRSKENIYTNGSTTDRSKLHVAVSTGHTYLSYKSDRSVPYRVLDLRHRAIFLESF